MKTASCGFLLLAFAIGGAAGTRLSAQSAPIVKGRLVNGSQMLRAGRQKGINSRGPGFDEGVARIPVAEKEFRLDLVHPDFKAQLWRGKTDAEGRFELVLNGVTRLPASACLVASVVSEALYSTAILPLASGETEFRLYGVSDDERSLLNNIIQVRFTLVDAPGGVGKLLDVRIDLLASNFVGDLFVGRPHVWADSPQSRAVFRIPLPDGAKVVSNQTFARPDKAEWVDMTDYGPSWTITDDGWAILDSPLAAYPEAPGGRYYKLRYRVPAEQEMVFAFPVDIPLKGMLVFSIHEDMEVSSPQLSKSGTDPQVDPDDGGKELTWNVNYGDAGFSAGETLSVILNIDSLVLRQINRGALKTVGALVIGCLIAILAGLYLGRRGPRVEALLSQASGEELIERIARLDVQFEKKLVKEAEYRNTRERLLSLARYEVPELAGVTAGLTAEAPPALGLPPEAARLIQRFREIDAESSGDPKQVQERLLLLEELAKILSRSPAANTVPDPVSNSGGADSKTEARR